MGSDLSMDIGGYLILHLGLNFSVLVYRIAVFLYSSFGALIP